MAKNDDSPLDQRGTSNRGNSSRTLAQRAKERPGKIEEIDVMRASIQTSFLVRIPQYSNADLIAEAHRLNNRFFQPEDVVGPIEKAAIGEVLIKMHGEMAQRIDEAAAKQLKWPPTLAGIKWRENDPVVGIVESISPFHMINFWKQLRAKSVPSVGRPGKRVKKYVFEEDELVEVERRKSSPRPEPSLREAVERIRKALDQWPKYGKQLKDLGPDLRQYCILYKVENPKNNAWYMSGAGIKDLVEGKYRFYVGPWETKILRNALSNAEKASLNNKFGLKWFQRLHYEGTQHQRTLFALELARFFADPEFLKYWYKQDPGWAKDARREIVRIFTTRHSDFSILKGLEALNKDIASADSWLRQNESRYTVGGGKSENLAIRLVKKKREDLAKDPNSVLSCFAKY